MAGFKKRREDAEIIRANWEELMAEIEGGKSDRNACIAIGLASDTGLRWLVKQDSTLAEQLAHARKLGADAMVSQTLDIADDVAEFALVDPLRSAEQRIKTRQWIASRRNRDAYGDQPKGANVTVNIAGLHLDALRRQPPGSAQAALDVIEGELVELPRLDQDKLEDIL